jgi:hypothetical protein
MALDLIEELGTLIDRLEAETIEYAVCGGLALAIHGRPRMTKDIDLLVPRSALPSAIRVAKTLGFDIPARRMVFRIGTLQENEMQRVSKLDDETGVLMPIDFLVVVPTYEEVWKSRLRAEWGGRQLTVVSVEGLATMKRLAGRPQDLADIAALERNEDVES